MAYIRPTKNGKHEVHIVRNGQRASKTFDTKAQATMWANQTEIELMGGKRAAANKTFGDVMFRYRQEHKLKNIESQTLSEYRIDRLLKDPLMKVSLKELRPIHFAQWRDRRLQDVCGASANRDITTMNAALKLAIREWGWLDKSPLKEIDKPKDNPPRKRRITAEEVDQIIQVTDYQREGVPVGRQVTGAVFLFAIETAMRAGEIVNLTADRVFLHRRVVHLRACDVKNSIARDVPLSSEAMRILKQMGTDSGKVFGIPSPSRFCQRFIDVRNAAGIEGLTFHDTRHEAITRLAKKFTVIELARVVGHSNMNQLLTYYNESADDLAKKLD